MSRTASPSLRELFERRLTRRELVQGGVGLVALSLGAGRAWPQTEPARRLGFPRMAGSKRDEVLVPDGYRADAVVRWGDPLFTGGSPLDAHGVAAGALLDPGAASAQQRQLKRPWCRWSGERRAASSTR